MGQRVVSSHLATHNNYCNDFMSHLALRHNLTRREDLLELRLQAPDLSIYQDDPESQIPPV